MAELALLVSGASGMRLPRELLVRLAARPDVERLHLVVSAGASQVLRHELGLAKPGAEALLDHAGIDAAARRRIAVYRDSELDAPIASGSVRLDGTVILPCSSSTIGALAVGTATTLLRRAGAVALKERWPLVIGFRETPLTIVHLENLRRLAYAGAVILPPIPAFYVGGEDLGRFVDAYLVRVLDHLGLPVESAGDLRWRDEEPSR